MAKGEELLRGYAASKGEASGEVYIVSEELNTPEKMNMPPGKIMVSTRFVPDDNPYMKKAAAFVTARGGAGSHVSIVAREWGLPAVAGANEAETILQNGQRVVVDGSNGIVYEYIEGEEIDKSKASRAITARFEEIANKSGIELPPGFLEKMKRRD